MATTITTPGTALSPLAIERRSTTVDESLAADEIIPMWRQRLRIFFHNKLAVASVVYLVIITAALLPGPDPAPDEPDQPGPHLRLAVEPAPSAHHWLGTDSSAASTSWGGSSTAASTRSPWASWPGFITIVVGTLYGMISGFIGGVTDTLMMRFLDAFLSIPYIFLLADPDRHLRPLDRVPDLRHRLHRVVGQRPHHPR